MSEQPNSKQLESIGRRVAANLPDEIHLTAAPQHAWTNAFAVEGFANSLRTLGFVDAGTYTVDVLPAAICFLLLESEQIYAAIYEHTKAGVWLNLVVLHEDDTSITFTTTQDRGLEKRPGHPIVYSPKATAAQLYSIAVAQSPRDVKRKPLSVQSIPRDFERAWADGVRWRKSCGISAIEAASVLFSRAGQPTRVLRPGRIHFVAEQDGEPERVLKASFAKLFSADPRVEKAYLLRVTYDEDPTTSVALCLVASPPPTMSLVAQIRKIFGGQFGAHEHLDIICSPRSDIPRIEAVSKPFYSRPA